MHLTIKLSQMKLREDFTQIGGNPDQVEAQGPAPRFDFQLEQLMAGDSVGLALGSEGEDL